MKVGGSAGRDRSLLNSALDEGWCSASPTDSYNLLPFPGEETHIVNLMGVWVSFGRSEVGEEKRNCLLLLSDIFLSVFVWSSDSLVAAVTNCLRIFLFTSLMGKHFDT